jgi:hypothetical protein
MIPGRPKMIPDILTTNPISAYSFTLFSILIGLATAIYRRVQQSKTKVENVAHELDGNDGSINAKLDAISTQIASVEKSVRRHLEWHMDSEKGTK